MGHWVDEARYYRPRPDPGFQHDRSRGGCRALHPDHLARHDGVRLCDASNATDDYLVCRYTPPGNVWGRWRCESPLPSGRGAGAAGKVRGRSERIMMPQ